MLWKKGQARIAGTLVLGVALLLSGGITQAAEENLIADKAFEVTQPEKVEIIKPEIMGVTQPEMLEVSEPKMLEISEPESLEAGNFPRGEYSPAERENPAYDRCATQEGFDAQLKCARETMGIAQE